MPITKPEEDRKKKKQASSDDEAKKLQDVMQDSSEEEIPKKKSPSSKSESKSKPKPKKPSSDSEEDEKMDSEPPTPKKESKKKPKHASDSEDKTPKKKSKKKAESDSEVEDDFLTSDKKSPVSTPSKPLKKKGASDEEVAAWIEEIKEEEEEKKLVVPEGVRPERMMKRLTWLWKEIGSKGIKMKTTKKELKDYEWLCIGTTKEMQPIFADPKMGKQFFNSPTEIMRAYQKQQGIELGAIKGWEQSQAYIKHLDGKKPAWMASNKIWPQEYRKQFTTKKTSKAVSKKRSRADREEEDNSLVQESNKKKKGDMKKKSRTHRVSDFIGDIDTLLEEREVIVDKGEAEKVAEHGLAMQVHTKKLFSLRFTRYCEWYLPWITKKSKRLLHLLLV